VGRRALRAATLGVGLIGSLFLGGCAKSQAQHSTPAGPPAGLGLPKQVGALAGRHWPAGSLRPGMLLYDNGRRLWSMQLDGSRTLLWRHPAIGLTDIAVAPDGRELAFAVTMRVRNSSGWGLWDLRPDGSIRLVDAVANFDFILTPTFMRVPEHPEAPYRLYWLRGSQTIDPRTGRFKNTVMSLGPRGRLEVDVPLRYSESPTALSAYPGSAVSSLVLSRRSNIPTRYVDLRSNDYFDRFGSATRLGEWEEVGNSDVNNGVTWLTPRWYVAAVGQQDTLPSFQMKRFAVQCEFYGSHRMTSGTRIAESSDDALWQPVALDDRRMLVLLTRHLRIGPPGTNPRGRWYVLDAFTGDVTRTALVWNGIGVWQSVRPASPVNLDADPHCNRTAWTYP
jgi:hypothetical protein